jgi:hypothetical protein
MKTRNIFYSPQWILTILFVTFLFSCQAQEVIRFKSGTTRNVKIVKLTHDTLYFHLVNEAGIIRVVPMTDIDSIFTPTKQTTPALSENEIESLNKKISRAKGSIAMGAIGITVGAGLLIGGLAMSTHSDNPNAFGESFETAGNTAMKVVLCVVGGAVTITGIAITIVNSSKLQEYKSKLGGVSLQVISSPRVTGLSLTYKF